MSKTNRVSERYGNLCVKAIQQCLVVGETCPFAILKMIFLHVYFFSGNLEKKCFLY